MSTYYSPKTVTDGLVLCLDATNSKSYVGSGTSWNDISGNNNTGTLVNGPTYTSSFGGGIVFDGTNDYVNVANNSLLTPTSSMSWEFVVNPSTVATYYKSIFSKNNYGNSTGFICLHTQGSSLRLEASDVASATRQIDTSFSNVLVQNTNVHCVLTYNSSVFTLYKNGLVAGAVSWTYGLGNNNVADFNIGVGWPGYWDGKIYVFKLYNRALSASEILQNYNATKGRYNL